MQKELDMNAIYRGILSGIVNPYGRSTRCPVSLRPAMTSQEGEVKMVFAGELPVIPARGRAMFRGGAVAPFVVDDLVMRFSRPCFLRIVGFRVGALSLVGSEEGIDVEGETIAVEAGCDTIFRQGEKVFLELENPGVDDVFPLCLQVSATFPEDPDQMLSNAAAELTRRFLAGLRRGVLR